MAAPKRPWDPWKVFDVSADELKAAQERAKMRAALKAEFQKKVTNPNQGANNGGFMFDPAIQRFMSMRASQADYFKASPKTVWQGFAFVVFPVALLSYLTISGRREREKKYRAGEISYKDRPWKFMY
ncbi:NADH dehydrogenase [ubiquinone] 1 beta subcomplex subunit 4-like [Haliotis asinina]|uniref:NADH dehydrogenase [ubiquinone] 1 beta subcomplex subunit 4-like n=1 Tax=Haliotis asinina TaxID=109174 RepID=UPI003531C5CA